MPTKALTKRDEFFPSMFNDFFKPWNEWFDGGGERMLSVPAVNVIENDGDYKITVAAPGLKKSDFKVGVDGNMLNISAESEEKKEEKNEKYTKQEYNYSSFSRMFTLPEDVDKEHIDAKYEDGILKLMLPKREQSKKEASKKIDVK